MSTEVKSKEEQNVETFSRAIKNLEKNKKKELKQRRSVLLNLIIITLASYITRYIIIFTESKGPIKTVISMWNLGIAIYIIPAVFLFINKKSRKYSPILFFSVIFRFIIYYWYYSKNPLKKISFLIPSMIIDLILTFFTLFFFLLFLYSDQILK